jgi:hypothetical protein
MRSTSTLNDAFRIAGMADEHDHELHERDAHDHESDGREIGLDPEIAARRAAAMSFIRQLGDPVLKSRAIEVDRFDDSLRSQAARMAGLMNDALGVGLAAPQLGISQRLLVYRVEPDAPVVVGAPIASGATGAATSWSSGAPYRRIGRIMAASSPW